MAKAVARYVVFHPWRSLVVLVVGGVIGLVGFYTYQVNAALGAVAVEEFDPQQARTAIGGDGGDVSSLQADPDYDLAAELDQISAVLADIDYQGDFNTAAFGEPVSDEVFEAYLLIGTDASGALADTIILALQPSNGASPVMVSLPRDLFVWNLCEQTFTRLNAGLVGCGDVATGSELMAIMVQDYTGIQVDHMARVDFDGFAQVVDVMGGIEVCVDHPTRDEKSHLDIEWTGCRTVDGVTALAWVRSRHPEQLIDGVWKSVAGSDFTRQDHQQDALFQLAGRAASFSSPASLAEKLTAVASSVRLDASWSLSQAVGAAWAYRGITRDGVARFQIAVEDYRTSYGAQVLLPTEPFHVQLAAVHQPG